MLKTGSFNIEHSTLNIHISIFPILTAPFWPASTAPPWLEPPASRLPSTSKRRLRPSLSDTCYRLFTSLYGGGGANPVLPFFDPTPCSRPSSLKSLQSAAVKHFTRLSPSLSHFMR